MQGTNQHTGTCGLLACMQRLPTCSACLRAALACMQRLPACTQCTSLGTTPAPMEKKQLAHSFWRMKVQGWQYKHAHHVHVMHHARTHRKETDCIWQK
eukprot:1138014-Pelagomonas_calceolata.AAC.1